MRTIENIATKLNFARIATLVVLTYSAAALIQMTGNVLAV